MKRTLFLIAFHTLLSAFSAGIFIGAGKSFSWITYAAVGFNAFAAIANIVYAVHLHHEKVA